MAMIKSNKMRASLVMFSFLLVPEVVRCHRNQFIRLADPQHISMTNTYHQKTQAKAFSNPDKNLLEEDLFT
jgi:hypothetical protein